jgi:hypothetical protein
MGRQLHLFINPRWTISKYEDYIDLPEGWDDWSESEKDAYVAEVLNEEVSDRGYTIVDDEDDGKKEEPEHDDVPLSAQVVSDLLGLVTVVRTVEQVEQWTPEQQREAANWAAAVHRDASDNDVEIPPKPDFLSGRTVPSNRAYDETITTTPGGTIDVSHGDQSSHEMPGMWDNPDVQCGREDGD